MRERKKRSRGVERFRPRDLNTKLLSVNAPPGGRRGIARNGDRAAINRRSEIDRYGGSGEPRGVPCDEGDHVATFAATPHHRTTRWHSLPRDRRGAWVG